MRVISFVYGLLMGVFLCAENPQDGNREEGTRPPLVRNLGIVSESLSRGNFSQGEEFIVHFEGFEEIPYEIKLGCCGMVSLYRSDGNSSQYYETLPQQIWSVDEVKRMFLLGPLYVNEYAVGGSYFIGLIELFHWPRDWFVLEATADDRFYTLTVGGREEQTDLEVLRFEVVSNGEGDGTPPSITALRLEKEIVLPGEDFRIYFRAFDEGPSGIRTGYPNGSYVSVLDSRGENIFTTSLKGGIRPLGGRDYVLEGRILQRTRRRRIEEGTYIVNEIRIKDNAGNYVSLLSEAGDNFYRNTWGERTDIQVLRFEMGR